MQRNARPLALTAVLAALTLTACSDVDPVASLMEQVQMVVEASPTSLSLAEGETGMLEAIVKDARGTPVETSIVWRSRNPRVAVTSANGEVLGLSEGTAFIYASAGTRRDSVEVRVTPAAEADAADPDEDRESESDEKEKQEEKEEEKKEEKKEDETKKDEAKPPSGRSGGYPKEPSGFSVIAASNMREKFRWGPKNLSSASGVGSWWQWREGDPDSSIGTESGIPGGPHFNRTRYKRGLEPGTAPVHWGAWNAGSQQQGDQYERIYFSKRIRFVDSGRGNWESQEVGTKLGFFGVGRCSGANNELYPFLQGGTRSQFTLRLMQQDVVSGARGQNRKGSAAIRVGRWHHWEMELVLNDIGRANGILRWWIDGELIMEHRDMVYRTRQNPCGFMAWKWNPTWGGTGGGTKSRDDFVDISDIRISGKRLR